MEGVASGAVEIRIRGEPHRRWSPPTATSSRVALLDHFAALRDPRQHAKVMYPLPENPASGVVHHDRRSGRLRRDGAVGDRASSSSDAFTATKATSHRPLAAYCVRGHDAAFQRQHLQKLGHGGDLVGLLIDSDLADRSRRSAAKACSICSGDLPTVRSNARRRVSARLA
jgi:hypothetical protein